MESMTIVTLVALGWVLVSVPVALGLGWLAGRRPAAGPGVAGHGSVSTLPVARPAASVVTSPAGHIAS